MWEEVYEHEIEGELVLVWSGEQGDRSSLVAILPDLWTTEESIASLLAWAREQEEKARVCSSTRSGDAAVAVPAPTIN